MPCSADAARRCKCKPNSRAGTSTMPAPGMGTRHRHAAASHFDCHDGSGVAHDHASAVRQVQFLCSFVLLLQRLYAPSRLPSNRALLLFFLTSRPAPGFVCGCQERPPQHQERVHDLHAACRRGNRRARVVANPCRARLSLRFAPRAHPTHPHPFAEIVNTLLTHGGLLQEALMALVQLHEAWLTSVGDSDRFGNDKKSPPTWRPPWRFPARCADLRQPC